VNCEIVELDDSVHVGHFFDGSLGIGLKREERLGFSLKIQNLCFCLGSEENLACFLLNP
jgi:hypothetical protein